MQGDIVTQGFLLLVYGMGVVIVFLTLLVLATGAMSSIVERYFPEAPPQPAAAQRRPAAPANADDEIAAIGAAIHLHRQRRPATSAKGASHE